MPSKSELDALEGGWAIRVVIERVRRLHVAVGTDPPGWLPWVLAWTMRSSSPSAVLRLPIRRGAGHPRPLQGPPKRPRLALLRRAMLATSDVPQ